MQLLNSCFRYLPRQDLPLTTAAPPLSHSLAVGHGADVKCCDWHPRKSLLVSGSKDNQQPVKLWDSRTGQSICTMSVRNCVAASMSVHFRILCQLVHLSLLLSYHMYMYQHIYCCVLILFTNNLCLDTLGPCYSTFGQCVWFAVQTCFLLY